MLQVKHDQYIFPPRSADAIPRDDTEFLGEMDWIGQLKYNDSRCVIKYCADGTVELWNRHAERFRSYHAPEHLVEQLLQLREILGLASDCVSMLDGGLLDQKHAAIKDTIAIWDILVRDDQHLIGTRYIDRYTSLFPKADHGLWIYEHKAHDPISLGHQFTEDLLIPTNHPATEWDSLWDTVATINTPFTIGTPNATNYEIKPLIEGLVFKDPTGTLEMGFKEKNNDSWMMRSRVQTGRHLF